MRERSDSHGGNLRQLRWHQLPAYGREGMSAGVAQRGGDSGGWTTVSYKRRKVTRPVDRGHDRPRFSSRHGGYREDIFYSSRRRHQDHSQDSRYLSCDSRDFGNLGFPGYSTSHHRFSHSRPSIHHHSRPKYHHSHSRPAPSRHHNQSQPASVNHRHSRPASLHQHRSRLVSPRHQSRNCRGRSLIRQEVDSRQQYNRHISVSVAPTTVSQGNNFVPKASFYVTNLPDNVHYVDIRKAFEVCGILSDVYVARNRNARGQNYGFVRFINVKDVVKLQKALNNVFFGQKKVWVNIACFDRFGEARKELVKELEDGKKSAEVGGKNKSKINAEIEKIEKKESKNMGGKNKSKNSVEGKIIIERGKNKEGEKLLYTKALARKQTLEQVKLNAKGSEEEREKAQLSVVVAGDISCSVKDKNYNHVAGGANVTRKFLSDNEDVVWASKGVFARVLNGDYIPIVQQKIIDAGFDNVQVLPRGGDNVVLFCPGKVDMMSVYLEAADFFNCFFSDMHAWSLNEDIVTERGIWLRIYGVPLHVWHSKFLEFISSSIGRLLKIDPCTTNLERFDFARILVSTNGFDVINEVENVLIDDKKYRIKLLEETEAVFARDMCFEEENSDSVSE